MTTKNKQPEKTETITFKFKRTPNKSDYYQVGLYLGRNYPDAEVTLDETKACVGVLEATVKPRKKP